MSLKNDIQQLNNRIDTCRHKLDAAKTRGDSPMTVSYTHLTLPTKRIV